MQDESRSPSEIAARVQVLLRRHLDSGGISAAATRLGVEERELQKLFRAPASMPDVSLLVAVIRSFGVDPTWLLSGTYDAETHHRADLIGSDIPRLRSFILGLMTSRGDRPSRPVILDESTFSAS